MALSAVTSVLMSEAAQMAHRLDLEVIVGIAVAAIKGAIILYQHLPSSRSIVKSTCIVGVAAVGACASGAIVRYKLKRISSLELWINLRAAYSLLKCLV